MTKLKPEPGCRYGRWALIEKIPGVKPAKWRCVCACGTKREVLQAPMVSGQSRSCGCATREAARAFSLAGARA